MVTRFGSREICDVTFKALTPMEVGTYTFAAGQPVFVIDTATTSNMEQATTTVYAQGGQGYNRLIAWEGEKTLTFTVTDALMSPLGLKVLTGAGFAKETATKHVHVTYDVAATVGSTNKSATGKIDHDMLATELGIPSGDDIYICTDAGIKTYATVLDNNGAIKDWVNSIALTGASGEELKLQKGNTVTFTADLTNCVDTYKENDVLTLKLDFYVAMTSGATEITIAPGDFGGYFYVEADTLYRNQDGKDMSATLTFPKVKIQSGFTITMAANGDPSTFDFVMDAFPAYTYFDKTKKTVVNMTIVSGESTAEVDVRHTDSEHSFQ